MKKLFLSLAICLLVNLSGHSQTIEWQMPVKDTLYEAKYNKFKELCIKMIHTESHIRFTKLHGAFMDKINFRQHFREIQMPTIMEWIKANLAKTKFASYEEAEKEWQVIMEAGRVSAEENAEYFAAVRELMKNGNREVLMNVKQDVRLEYPDLH